MNIKITSQMIAEFARITGDQSSLHVDQDFARRMMFRKPVSHGCLPLVFLMAHPDLALVSGWISSFSVKFLKPVFAADELELSIKEAKPGVYKFVFTKAGGIVTQGQVSFNTTVLPVRMQEGSDIMASSLIQQDQSWDFLQVGQESDISFQVSSHVGIALSRLCGAQAISNSWENLWALLMTSTFVGMTLPGKWGMFLSLQVNFKSRVSSQGPCTWKGQIETKSDATKIVTLACQLYDVKASIAEATIMARVNTTPIKMSSLKEVQVKIGDMGLKDQVVLITGASRGIGEVMAKAFGIHGAKVAVHYFKGKDDAEAIVSELKSSGIKAIAVGADVSQESQVKAMVEQVRKELGDIDVLVNNAVADAMSIPFAQLTWADIQKDLDIVLKGAFLCCKEVLPMMVTKKSGSIINIGTHYIDEPVADQSKYIMTKTALLGLTRSLAIEYASHHIRVNMVSPSLVKTDLSSGVGDVFLEGMRANMPLGRLALPEDVAGAVVYLASKWSSFTTGQKIMVTGGRPPFL